ncbi:MAG: hypothetical protein JHC33_03735 [Ignisphaera sp.]|nr:hypothetical protein [Ignisphaera sp.]
MIKVNLDKLKQTKLTQLKSYTSNLLSQTDYIIAKITEIQLLNDTNQLEFLKQKYSTQLQQRTDIRTWNEQTKQAINNATTLDTLNSIEIKYSGDK